jgi:D-arginine dehydrogenase
MTVLADILVIGGGIAGASAAYELAAAADVVLLEREAQCGYHATGRSAASFTENYGTDVIRRLVLASRDFLTDPPGEFAEQPLLMPRGMITIAREDQLGLLDAELERGRRFVPSMRRIGAAEAIRLVLVLRSDYLADAILEPGSMDVDVHGLHQGYLRGLKRRGGRIATDAGVRAIARNGAGWRVTTSAESYAAPALVNAAGAWADEIAALAGLHAVGLVAKRRSAFNIAAPAEYEIERWPLVNDVGEEFYFKPDAGQLLVSPADAVPSAPGDVQPDDLDVAIGAERLERATTITVRRIAHKWAGLRTFPHDGSPVVGEDPAARGFYWLAGQGGYGIKTAPALALMIASLVLDARLPAALIARGIDVAELSPARFAVAAHSP